MNRFLASTAKRLLGERRAEGCFRFGLSMILYIKSNAVWRFPKDRPVDDLHRYEAKAYSQSGEDGMIAAIFRRVGATNHFCVEFGVGDGSVSNTAYLVRRLGWSYLWMDAREGASKRVKKEFITAENINSLFEKYGVPKEFDLLSIDVDYNTYWVWKAIEGFSPRVVVIEYNSSLPQNESVAVQYDPTAVWDRTNYFGASLLAMAKLGALKGYTLVACDSAGIDAFFVRNDIREGFSPKSLEEVYRPPHYGELVDGRYVGHLRSDRKLVNV